MVKQKTIINEISLTGVGLHTGKEVTMTFKPAPINNGYSFVRVDLEGSPIIEADASYVVNTQRGTNLEKLGVTIQTSEHVLAAFVGCDVDNVIIELNASEPPIMDGSSKYFVEAIQKTGVIEQAAERKVYIVKDEGGMADTKTITISCSVGSQTIDGNSTITIESPYAAVNIYCNGLDKYFIY